MIAFFQLMLIAVADFVRMLFSGLKTIFGNDTHYNFVKKNVAIEEKKKIINKRQLARLSDFEHLNLLGTGTFGQVYQVRNKQSGGIFALKEIYHPETETGERHLKDELRVLLNLKSQFLCEMFHYFKTEAKVYFVFEYLIGGELLNLLEKKGKFSEKDTRFYVAEVTLGLEFLHSHDVVHRDLKPENLMLDAQGHVKIIDLGSCKILRKGQKTYSLCGTRTFLAPEVISCKAYDHAVDLWALGAVMFEFLTGRSLFAGETDAIVNQKILSGKRLPRSRFISAQANNLMEKLLKVCPLQRTTLPDVKQSAFFRTTNWEKVKSRHYRAPHIPKLSGESDVSYFDEFFTYTKIFRPPHETIIYEEIETSSFHDFDFETNTKKR